MGEKASSPVTPSSPAAPSEESDPQSADVRNPRQGWSSAACWVNPWGISCRRATRPPTP